MPTFETAGKLAYMYDEPTDTWHVLSGVANTSLNYVWTGSNTFDGVVTMSDVVTSQAGINNFQNPSIRDAVITDPVNGTVVFVRQDSEGNPINQLQYYSSGSWKSVSKQDYFTTKSSDHTLTLADSGKTILMNSTSDNYVNIPNNSSVPFAIGEFFNIVQYGVGQTIIDAPYGVILNSKSFFRAIDGQYGVVKLVKVGSNTWLLSGDLKYYMV